MLSSKAERLSVNRAFRRKGLPVRVCGLCYVVKHRSAFNAHSKTPDGIRPDCRDCTRAAKRAWNVGKREHRAEYRRSNAGEIRGYRKQWREDNRLRDRGYSAKRRALKRETTVAPFTDADLLAHWDAIGAYACVACGGPFEHIDHVMPLALGGAHVVENLLPMCEPCNVSKNAKDPWEWAVERGWLRG